RRRRHTRFSRDWSSDVCSSDLLALSSFLSSKRLDKILSVAKPGDYLFIEFGHNDQKEKGEKAGAYNGYTERMRHFVKAFREAGEIGRASCREGQCVSGYRTS